MARKVKLSKGEKVNRDIARWEAKQEAAVIMLRKSAEELVRLRRWRKRELARETKRALATPKPPEPTLTDGLDIPASLARDNEPVARPGLAPQGGARLGCAGQGKEDRARRLQTLPDPRSPEKRAERRAVEKEVRQAELTGKRRKMPLSGAAAVKHIRETH